MSDSQFETTTQAEAGSARVTLRGELDLASVEAAERALLAAEQTDRGAVLIDLSGLTFIDSSGLRFVLRADRRSRENGGPPDVQRVFRLTGIEQRLPFQAVGG